MYHMKFVSTHISEHEVIVMTYSQKYMEAAENCWFYVSSVFIIQSSMKHITNA